MPSKDRSKENEVPTIEGVQVENPAAVWHQLKEARATLTKGRWLKGSWFEPTRDAEGMCLANALRFAMHGRKNNPRTFAKDATVGVTEQLLLQVIRNSEPKWANLDEIPTWNDAEERGLSDVVKVLDATIALVQPFAYEFTTTYAPDVMTKGERREMDQASWEAQTAIWREAGMWGPEPQISGQGIVARFKNWLTDHEARGWSTFWDELAECDPDDQDCQERMKQLVS